MKNEVLKKFDKKKQLLVSPLALVISACGGGATSEGDDGTSSSEASKNKSVDLTYSQKLDFSSLSEDLVVPANYEMNWLGKQKYGASEYFFAVMMSPNIIHISRQLDSDLVVLPSWYAYEPFLAAFSLQKDLDDVISLGAIDTSTKIGWARNWEEIVVNGNKAVVIADTGHELATGQNTWLKGDIWLANLSGKGEFEISAISGINAFYHDVDVGDINDDGLEDILAINMSYDDGADPYPLHVFFQQQDGTFNQQLGFMSFTDNLPMLGGASGAVVDLEDGVEAFIPSRLLEKEDGSKLNKGETAVFKVIEFSKEFRRIVASHTATFKDAEAKNVKAQARKAEASAESKSTFGDIAGLADLKKKMEGK